MTKKLNKIIEHLEWALHHFENYPHRLKKYKNSYIKTEIIEVIEQLKELV